MIIILSQQMEKPRLSEFRRLVQGPTLASKCENLLLRRRTWDFSIKRKVDAPVQEPGRLDWDYPTLHTSGQPLALTTALIPGSTLFSLNLFYEPTHNIFVLLPCGSSIWPSICLQSVIGSPAQIHMCCLVFTRSAAEKPKRQRKTASRHCLEEAHSLEREWDVKLHNQHSTIRILLLLVIMKRITLTKKPLFLAFFLCGRPGAKHWKQGYDIGAIIISSVNVRK